MKIIMKIDPMTRKARGEFDSIESTEGGINQMT